VASRSVLSVVCNVVFCSVLITYSIYLPVDKYFSVPVCLLVCMCAVNLSHLLSLSVSLWVKLSRLNLLYILVANAELNVFTIIPVK